ncbi:unnamed protein product [Caenorhabditis sp. 36 PRJEB53466]|nr:unnamed protein product [Caenorhabditis sp. 36 PRJEB53466]
MDVLIDFLSEFNHTFFPCNMCDKIIHSSQKLLEHLEECEMTKEMPHSCKRVMIHEAKWKESYNTYRNFHLLIKRGGRPFPDGECFGCDSLADHKAGKCKRVARVAAYEMVTREPLQEMSANFEQYLFEKVDFNLEDTRNEFRCKITNLENQIEQLQKDFVFVTCKYPQTPLDNARFIRKKMEALQEQLREMSDQMATKVREHKQKLMITRRREWHSFTNTISNVRESDMNAHRTFDTRFQRELDIARLDNPHATLPDAGPDYLRLLDAHICTERRMMERMRPMDPDFRERLAERYNQNLSHDEYAYMRLEIEQNNRPRVLQMRSSLEDRLLFLRHFEQLRPDPELVGDPQRVAYRYNTAVGWYHMMVEERNEIRVKWHKEIVKAVYARNMLNMCHGILEYRKSRPYIAKIAGWALVVSWTIKLLMQYRFPGRVLSPVCMESTINPSFTNMQIFDEHVVNNLEIQKRTSNDEYVEMESAYELLKAQLEEEGKDSENHRELLRCARQHLQMVGAYFSDDTKNFRVAERFFRVVRGSMRQAMGHMYFEDALFTMNTFDSDHPPPVLPVELRPGGQQQRQHPAQNVVPPVRR